MSAEGPPPPDVAELFRELGDVLQDARDRLEALLKDAIPAQHIRNPAGPTTDTH